jgi:hypothetical protein
MENQTQLQKMTQDLAQLNNILTNLESGRSYLDILVEFLSSPNTNQFVKEMGIKQINQSIGSFVASYDKLKIAMENNFPSAE